MTTRKELVRALRVRYGGAALGERIKVLDEFVALTGYHRKHAIRVLCAEVRRRVLREHGIVSTTGRCAKR